MTVTSGTVPKQRHQGLPNNTNPRRGRSASLLFLQANFLGDRSYLQTHRVTRMWWAEEPEQGSLRAIIQAQSRKCILVRGIAWTGIHLRILNVRFLPGDEQLANARSMWQTWPGEIAVEEYLRSSLGIVQNTGIRKVLELLDIYNLGPVQSTCPRAHSPSC